MGIDLVRERRREFRGGEIVGLGFVRRYILSGVDGLIFIFPDIIIVHLGSNRLLPFAISRVLYPCCTAL